MNHSSVRSSDLLLHLNDVILPCTEWFSLSGFHLSVFPLSAWATRRRILLQLQVKEAPCFLLFHIQGDWSYVEILPWFVWSWVLYSMRDKVLVSVFYRWLSNLSSTIWWRCYLCSSIYFCLHCQKSGGSMCVDLYLKPDLWFYFIHQCGFIFCLLPCCFCYSSAVYLKTRNSDVFSSSCIVQNCLSSPGISEFQYGIQYGFFFSFCEELRWNFERDWIKSVNCFWQNGYFHNMNHTNPWPWVVFPTSVIFFCFFGVVKFCYVSVLLILLELFQDILLI